MNTPRLCVYTVLMGDYERLNEQPVAADGGVDFICLTDRPGRESGTWRFVGVDCLFELDYVRSQRAVKCDPRPWLGDYDVSLYIDNSVVLKETGRLQALARTRTWRTAMAAKSALACFPNAQSAAKKTFDWAWESRAPSLRLTASQRRRFERDSYVGPFDLLSGPEAARYSRLLEDRVPRYPFLDPARFEKDPEFSGYWMKSAHAVIPELLELGARPELLDRVASLLGPDLVLWGSQFVQRTPGQAHRWHEDLEHAAWKGVTVWCGLENLTSGTCLKLIPGSHRFGAMPQELALEKGFSLTDDEAVLRQAREFDPAAQIVQVDMRPGQFFIFAGRTWHGSPNTTGLLRSAALFQYSPPSEEIRIPAFYDQVRSWHPVKPPCVRVRGQDRFGRNRLIPAPSLVAL